MLLSDKTLEMFGYTFESLSEKSSKKVLVKCDYCEKEYEVSKKNRHTNHLVVPKDACNKCKYIKMRETNLAKYGCENVFQSDLIKAKVKSSNIKKYGVDVASKNKSVKNKIKATNLEKYGATTFLGSDIGQNKLKEVCLEKYGVENASSCDSVKEKRRETCQKKFGKATYLGSDDCKKATEEKLGVDNVFKLPEYQEIARSSMVAKYGVHNLLLIPEIARKISEKSYQTKLHNGDIKQYENKTISDWSELTGFSKSHFSVLVNRHGWDLAVNMTPKMSSIESIVENFLVEYGISYEKQTKIGKYRADFLIGDLVLELDGLYWHSEHHKHKNYHAEKRSFYIENGFKPLFFRENEILQSFSIVKSIILNKMGKSKRLFARKLTPKEITRSEGANFFKENHLMGAGAGRCFALASDDIYCVMQVKKIRDGWEISRFANKLGYTVVGGYSRLLSFTEKPIITFVDLRYGLGNPSEFGFEYCGTNLSFKWTNGTKVYNRMQFPGVSGYDHGFFKLWDCGQAKWRINR